MASSRVWAAAGADQLEHALRRVGALDFELAELAELELALDQRRGRGTDRGRADRSERFHPLAKRGRVADRREIHVQVVADRADDHLARVESTADLKAGAVGPRHLGGEVDDVALEAQHREARPARMLLVGERGAKDGHQTIAGELVDRTLEPVDRAGGDRQEAIEDGTPALGLERARQLHRADDVGEEHRHLLALALDPGALGADPLGERIRDAERRARLRQRRAAALAEAGAPGRRVAAFSALLGAHCLSFRCGECAARCGECTTASRPSGDLARSAFGSGGRCRRAAAEGERRSGGKSAPPRRPPDCIPDSGSCGLPP